jgi:E3 ubiquitin-protein ligase TRIP12
MQLLAPDEIGLLLLGEGESGSEWSIESLKANTKAEHGYDGGSRVIGLFFQVLAERFSPADRRQFLLFATGCPRLPVGGFAALNPRLTVVDKGCLVPDEVLPSVMTCVSYLKLPNYSSIDILEAKLRTAIQEAGGFHLS